MGGGSKGGAESDAQTAQGHRLPSLLLDAAPHATAHLAPAFIGGPQGQKVAEATTRRMAAAGEGKGTEPYHKHLLVTLV